MAGLAKLLYRDNIYQKHNKALAIKRPHAGVTELSTPPISADDTVQLVVSHLVEAAWQKPPKHKPPKA